MSDDESEHSNEIPSNQGHEQCDNILTAFPNAQDIENIKRALQLDFSDDDDDVKRRRPIIDEHNKRLQENTFSINDYSLQTKNSLKRCLAKDIRLQITLP